MQRPTVLRSSSDGRFFRFQRLAARGLRQRLHQLKDSWSNDSSSLEEKKEMLSREFDELQRKLEAEQADALHSAYERWDEEIDKLFRTAERETLLSLRSEKEILKKLKTQFVENKSLLRKKRDEEHAQAVKLQESRRVQATNVRDNIRNRIESDRYAAQVSEKELIDWFSSATGREIANTNIPLSDERISSIAEIQELPAIAKSIEQQKAIVSARSDAIPALVRSKSRWRLAMASIGPVVCIAIGLVAWGLSAHPLFVAILTVAACVASAVLVYIVSGSLIGKSALTLVPSYYSEQSYLFGLLDHTLKLADIQHQRELKRIAAEHQAALQRIETNYEAGKQRNLEQFEQKDAATVVNANKRRWELTQARKKYSNLSDSNWGPEIETQKERAEQQTSKLAADREGEKQNLVNRFLKSQLRCADRWREGAESTQDWIESATRYFQRTQPDWSDKSFQDGSWKRSPQNLVWRIGQSPIVGLLSDQVSAYNPRLGVEAIDWPVVFDLLHHGALILDGANDMEPAAQGVITNLLLRAATSTMPGSMRFTIIDPQGLGKKYSWLMSLSDIDPSLVGDRVWTQPIHIADQLANIARSCEDIIQQSLRNNFSNLYEYNLQAGPMAMPYRIVVWDQFPSGLDESSWNSLCSILAAGGRCGVGVVLRLSPSYVWPSFADSKQLEPFGLHLTLDAAKSSAVQFAADWHIPEFEHASIQLFNPPSSDAIREIMGHHQNHMAQMGKVVVPFDSIVAAPEEQQSASSAAGLHVPIGIASSGRSQSLKLGEGTAQHVLIAGKTGSGKSSLLHTLITSAALKYAPDQLRLVLLDFKKGVEFQVYAETKLSHADVIGIESKREFGVSTLEYVDRIMNARGELFRSLGVQDVPSLSKKHPDIKMPRILIVIDEFQELFVEDDKLSQQASLLMDRIVRQGRSFGVHLVLASQTLGGAYSLPRTTLAQMAVRIALQCDSSDAMLILSEDNTAAERLRFSGQAIYNDAGGRIESNHGFQVAYATKDTLIENLVSVPRSPFPTEPTINPIGRQIIFEGHRPAVWDESAMDLLLARERAKDASAFPLLLGDSVSIDPPVVRRVGHSAGRNVAVVGSDDRVVSCLLASLAQGLEPNSLSDVAMEAHEQDLVPGGGNLSSSATDAENAISRSEPSLVRSPDDAVVLEVLDGTRVEEVQTKLVIEAMANLPFVKVRSSREVDTLLLEWGQELARRLDSPVDGGASTPVVQHKSKVLCIVNLARFRELRKGDEFSFGDSDSSSQPDVVLANLLKDGPAVGLHVWLWADSANTLSRWMSRQSMRELEMRVLMQMSSNDSNQLIDSNAANKLESNLVVFQDEMDGKPIKIRPFAWETLPLFKPR